MCDYIHALIHYVFVMALCGFSALLDGSGADSCGVSSEYPEQQCIPLSECQKDISGHIKLEDCGLDNEMKLLLARAGVFQLKQSHFSLTICPQHRAKYGIRWRTSRVRCSVPQPLIAHKSPQVKGTRRMNSTQSSLILKKTGQLIVVGSPICYTCFRYLTRVGEEKETQKSENIHESEQSVPCDEEMVASEGKTEKEQIRIVISDVAEIEKGSTNGESASDVSEGLCEEFSQLKVTDKSFVATDTVSSSSNQSDVSSSDNIQKEKLNEFLVSCDLPPLQKEWLAWNECSAKTRERYTKRCGDIVGAVLKTVSSENAGNLWQALESTSIINSALGIDHLSLSEKHNLEAFAEAYTNASSWDTRRQVLSIMAGVASYNTISMFIPGLTKYRYTVANLHRLQYGRGASVPSSPKFRIKIDQKQLDHFLCFITSPHIVQDLPFGQKHLKLSSGLVLEVPNVLRTMLPKRIARQYSRFCEETNFHPFSESTMLRILSECSASVRKSLQGLDYFAAEGTRAFDELLSLAHKMTEYGTDREWEAQISEVLKAAKLYLKGDYKVHLEGATGVPDHCIVYALSDPGDKDFKKVCDHKHEYACDQCQALEECLEQIKQKLNDCTFPSKDEEDEALYIVQSSTIAIQSWKCHILRSLNQDQARHDYLQLLDSKTVLIVNDWAMKFLPKKYRESQSDWFAKRGISWHISVVYCKSNDGTLRWQGFIHIIQSCSQESNAVVCIMQDVLNALKQQYPSITKAYLRQDNAGCYHSAETVLACPAISKSTGVKIVRIDFSDPQGGKGAADRLAATCKAHVRAFINEGNDVTNASQLKDALLSRGGIQGVRVTCLQAIDGTTTGESPGKIPNISKLNNFQFKRNITGWRAYGMGKGKTIEVNKQAAVQYQWLHCTFSPGDFKSLSTRRNKSTTQDKASTSAEDNDPHDEYDHAQNIFTCPENGCTKVFQRYSSLEKHLSSEKCVRSLEKHSMLDLAKLGYKRMVEEGVGVVPVLKTSSTPADNVEDTPLREGWALRASKKSYRFNDHQKIYLNAKFQIGQTTGRKVNADDVAREMRRARNTAGVRLFTVSEFLSTQQISSYFSRRSSSIRKKLPLESDVQAIVEEVNFATARDEVLAALDLQHPITYDQYNVCALFHKDGLKGLKVALLQVICQNLGLSVPQPLVRRKAPYLALLSEAVGNCGCSNQH